MTKIEITIDDQQIGALSETQGLAGLLRPVLTPNNSSQLLNETLECLTESGVTYQFGLGRSRHFPSEYPHQNPV